MKLGNHRQGPGAHVDHGLGGVHHVGVGVAQNIRCIFVAQFFMPNQMEIFSGS